MKKTIIITLAAVGIIAGYMLINPADDATGKAQDESPAETNDSTIPKTVDLPNPSLSNESDTALLTMESMRGQTTSSLEKSMQDEIANAMKISNQNERYLNITEILKDLSPDNWYGALYAFKEYAKKFPREWEFFIGRSGEVSGREAMLYFKNNNNRKICLQSWIMSNPDEAINWLKTETDPYTQKRDWGVAVKSIALSNPYSGVELLEQLPVNAREQYTGDLVKSFIKIHGIEATERVFLAMVDRAAANNELDSPYITSMFNGLAVEVIPSMLKDDEVGLDNAAAWLNEHMGNSYVNNALLTDVVGMLARRDGSSAIAWLDYSFAQHPNREPRGYATAIDTWTKVEGVSVVGDWLNKNNHHPAYDKLVFAHVKNLIKEDPELAMLWTNTISDEELKSNSIKKILFKKKTLH